MLQEVQQGLAATLGPHRIAQRRAQPLQHTGLQQKVLDGFTLTAQHFLQQVLHHIAMTAAERRDEACRVIMVVQGKGRQMQASDPAFGARLQQPTLLG